MSRISAVRSTTLTLRRSSRFLSWLGASSPSQIDGVGAGRLHDLADRVDLAATDVGRRVGRLPALVDRLEHRGAGGLGKQRELGHRVVGILGRALGPDADQDDPLEPELAVLDLGDVLELGRQARHPAQRVALGQLHRADGGLVLGIGLVPVHGGLEVGLEAEVGVDLDGAVGVAELVEGVGLRSGAFVIRPPAYGRAPWTHPRFPSDRRTVAPAGGRLLGLTGAPGAGKSTFAAALALGHGGLVVPMDGFHLADVELAARGLLDRKGAPETFDAEGYAALLARMRPAARRAWRRRSTDRSSSPSPARRRSRPTPRWWSPRATTCCSTSRAGRRCVRSSTRSGTSDSTTTLRVERLVARHVAVRQVTRRGPSLGRARRPAQRRTRRGRRRPGRPHSRPTDWTASTA